jgi:PPK2 family polyphosphate:nucleotide phosphotransferase
MEHEDFIRPLIVRRGSKISLKKDYDPGYSGQYVSKQGAKTQLKQGVADLREYQDKLYAQAERSLLIILQAMDAAGKDGLIKHVMSGLNPQGTQVYSFKAPSPEELDHDYLWRCSKVLPERGRIGIFNRSYYEEVLIVRVHPEILGQERLPEDLKGKDIWQHRFEEMNAFERYLVDNGITVLKFFLNVSKQEQKQRFLQRIDRPDKNWKFSADDLKERGYWDEYMGAYEAILNHTSTDWAPWYVLPADHKWFTRLAAAEIISHALRAMHPAYPEVTPDQKQALQEARRMLESAD